MSHAFIIFCPQVLNSWFTNISQLQASVCAGCCTACTNGCMLKSVYECTVTVDCVWMDAHRYSVCIHDVHVCRLHSVGGACPWDCSLSSLHKGPVCSPWWHLTQCLSSSPVSRALCPATRPVNTHRRAPRQPCPDRIMTHAHKHAHAHHRHPGKVDLSLSWITGIHTASCLQNNLISLTPFTLGLQRGLCLCQISLWLICGWNPQQDFSAHSSSFITTSYCCEEEGGEEEITFTAGRSDFTYIIHRMEINSHCIYSFLITSALWDDEYA